MIGLRSNRALACALAFSLVLPGVARADDLSHSIDGAVAKMGKDAHVSVLVRSVTTGETLYERDADVARAPASTMKLATTAAALELLGADFQHETGVYVLGTLGPDGILKGDLLIRGSGDPSISRRFQVDDAPLLADWADELKKKIRVVEGDVIGDDRAFERSGFHPDWNPKESQDWYAAPVSGLNLNDNCLDIETRSEGSGIHVVARPETHAVTLDVKAAGTANKADHRLSYVRDLDGTTFHVTGKFWTKSPPFEASVAVTSPALLFANVLSDRLTSAGITVKGKARLVVATDAEPRGTPLLVRRSPLPRTLMVCNKRSQNLYAECLLKTLGLRKGAAGSWDEGAKVVEKFLRGLEIPATETNVADGSGLSRENRLSANALVRILTSVSKGKNATVFVESLSIAGTDGTLEKRLKDLPAGSAFRGKTGTMHGVSSLAGLLEIDNGAHGEPEVIAIAFIVNGTHGAALARGAQDEAVRATIRHYATSGRRTLKSSKP